MVKCGEAQQKEFLNTQTSCWEIVFGLICRFRGTTLDRPSSRNQNRRHRLPSPACRGPWRGSRPGNGRGQPACRQASVEDPWGAGESPPSTQPGAGPSGGGGAGPPQKNNVKFSQKKLSGDSRRNPFPGLRPGGPSQKKTEARSQGPGAGRPSRRISSCISRATAPNPAGCIACTAGASPPFAFAFGGQGPARRLRCGVHRRSRVVGLLVPLHRCSGFRSPPHRSVRTPLGRWGWVWILLWSRRGGPDPPHLNPEHRTYIEDWNHPATRDCSRPVRWTLLPGKLSH